MVKKVTNEDIVMLLNEGVVKEQIQTRILLPQILVSGLKHDKVVEEILRCPYCGKEWRSTKAILHMELSRNVRNVRRKCLAASLCRRRKDLKSQAFLMKYPNSELLNPARSFMQILRLYTENRG